MFLCSEMETMTCCKYLVWSPWQIDGVLFCIFLSQCFVPFSKNFETKHVFKLKTILERRCFSSVREGDPLVNVPFLRVLTVF